MAKKITGYLKLQVPAGAANPSPPIGPALGQRGLNIMEFCKAFNAQTAEDGEGRADPRHHHGLCRPLVHLRDEDAAGVATSSRRRRSLQSGSKTPGRDKAGSVTKAQVREIAEQKMKDLNCDTVEAAMRMVEGSARSMGLEVRSNGHGSSENARKRPRRR